MAGADSPANQRTEVLLSWRDLSVKLPGGGRRLRPPKYLLRHVSGFAQPGSLLAIMGPSGCGKTTLLNALAGRLGNASLQSGEILANGRKQQLTYGNSAYVTQDDSLIATLTVYETIVYAAHLQLPKGMSKYERHAVVLRTIREMGLQDCVNTKIGGWYVRGISGGQKRRVSIAIEILKQPQLLFLDEPTSGLDSAAALYVVKRLHALAKAGRRTVLVSIHQPSSEAFGLFDFLCLLSYGQMVYFGERDKSLQFFEDVGFPCPTFRNPSDHFLWVINSDFQDAAEDDDDLEIGSSSKRAKVNTAQGLIKAYGESDIMRSIDMKIQQSSQKEGELLGKCEANGVSFSKQAYYLTSRSFTNMRRDLTYYWFRAFVYIMLSICIGTIYHNVGLSYNAIQARAGMFTFVTAFLTFMGVASFPSFIEDMKIFTRERLNGHYGVGVFVVANTLSSFPFVILMSLSPAVVIYSMGGLHPGFDQFLCFWATLCTCLSIVEGLLMAIATIVPDFLTGMIVGCGVMGIYLLNGGFFRLLNDLPKPVWRYPLSYVSFHSWATKAFFNNDFNGLQFENNVVGGPPLRGEDIVRDIFQMHLSYSKWWAVFVLACMAIAYRLIFFSSLKVSERLTMLIHNVELKQRVMIEKVSSGRFVVPHDIKGEEIAL